MFTPFFERYVEPARARPQIWRLIVSIIVIAATYLAWVALLFGLLYLVTGPERAMTWANRVVEASTPTGTLLLMASFVGMALGPILAARWLHKRGAGTLFGPSARVLRDFVKAAATVLALYVVMLTLWSIWFDARPNLDPWIWLSFLPLAIVGLLIQTGAEEMLFRGFLMQQLAARFRSPLIWIPLPALAFGILHYDPASAGGNAWLIVASATLFGLVAADLTRITGTLGAAWGYHFANNVAAVLIIATDGTLPGLALYVTPYGIDDTTLLPLLSIGDLAAMLIVWLILRRALRP